MHWREAQVVGRHPEAHQTPQDTQVDRRHYTVCNGEKGEKGVQNGLCTMKRGGTGDRRVERIS